MAEIIKFLGSVPELINLAKTVWAWLQKMSGNDAQGFIIRANEAFTLLHQAQTEKEMQDAAKAIQDLIRRT